MTVSELIAVLQKLDPNMGVVVEDGLNPSDKTVVADVQVGMWSNVFNDVNRNPDEEPPHYVYLS